MPWGIDIPDLNPFNDEDEKPRKRPKVPRTRSHDIPIPKSKRAAILRKQKANRARIRAAERREEERDVPGFMEILGKARKEARSFPSVIGQIAGETTEAGYKDIRNALPGKDPFPYAMIRDPKTGKLKIARGKDGKPIKTGGHLFEYGSHTADLMATETARWGKDVGLVVLADDWTVEMVKKFDKAKGEALERKSKQAERRLAEAPIGTLTGLFGGAGIASKAFTVPAMARRMQKANPELSAGAARAAATQELKNPGAAAAMGVKGGLPPRTITTAEGKTATGRPWSRTPGGRVGQTIYDDITTAIDKVSPNAPFAASKRIGSIERRRDAQISRGELAALTPAIQQIGDILEGVDGRLPSKAKARRAIGRPVPIRERAEALIAALEGPQDATVRQSVEARIASLEDTLAKSEKLTPQYNRVKVLRKKLESAVDEDARKAIGLELREVTDSLDLALGRKVAPVTGSPERRRAIREYEKRFGKRKANNLIVVSDAIARAQNPTNPKAWYAQNLAEVTSEEAQKFIDRIDPIAAQYQTATGKRYGLRDPGQRSVVGPAGDAMELLSPSEAKDAVSYLNRYPDTALVYRRADGTFGVMVKYAVSDAYPDSAYRVGTVDPNEFGLAGEVDWEWGHRTPREARKELRESSQIMAGEEAQVREMAKHLVGEIVEEPPVFYSQLQREVDKLFSGKTQRMKAQSLKAKLKNNISAVEWDAMGLEDFFDLYKPTERITEAHLQDYLSDPLNAYNLDEFLFSSAERNHHFRDRWGGSYNWRLVHKEAKGDEVYYELVMAMGNRMPGQVRDFKTMHWQGIDNPIVHVRFMVITDNTGKRAIVIDEIQSDWASDVRKRKERDLAHPIPGVAEIERQIADLHDEVVALRQQHPALDRLDDLKDDYEKAVRAKAEATRQYNRGLDLQINDISQATLKVVLDDRSRWLTDAHRAWREVQDQIPTEVMKRMNEGRATEQKLYAHLRYAKSEAERPQWKLKESHIDAALRRMMRFAHDDEIDRIIIAPPELQVMRNASLRETPSGERIPNPHDTDIDVSEWSRLWQQFRGMDPEALRKFIADRAGTEENKGYFRLYGKDFPNKLAKHIGHDGRFIPGVMNARFADEAGLVEAPETPMGAWVIDLGPEGRRRAGIPMRQMQQQPEWDSLPRGATELLADGRQAMRLFEGADVDTVIHELAHIAMPDMDEQTRSIIEGHFGGKYEDWTTGQSEAFARAFEQYMRTGRAANVHLASAFTQIAKWMRQVWRELYHGRKEEFDLHPQLAAAYDQMLGYQGVPTVLSKTERSQVRSQIKALTDALDLPLDSPEYADAVQALEMISEQIETAGEQILTRNAPPALADAIKEGLGRRRDIMTTRMAEQGVLPEGVEWTPEMRARGYFPQTSIWDIQGMPQASPVRMAAVQDVVGTPRLENKAVMRKPNRLIRYSTGEVLNDPAVLVRVLRSRMRFLNTLDARNELWDQGKPIKKGQDIPRGVALVRNPNVTPDKIRDDIYAALRLDPERYAELEARGKLDEIDEAEDLKEAVSDFIWMPGMEGPKPHWVSDAKNVRTIPLGVARTRLGDVFSSAPRGPFAPIAGGANAMARLAAIYLPFMGTRYVTRNAAQNMVMLALTQPKALARIGRRHTTYKKDHPENYARIMAEGGTILGTALPEFNTRPKGLAQEMEQYVTERTGAAGSYLGKFADNPFRFASWTKHAEGYGYDTPAKHHRLMTDPELQDVRETVMQRTRDDMIDFDALTPFEKEVMSRYMFLWPFIRGITKWPFMFAREHPLRVTGVAALAQGIEDEDSPLDTGAVRERLIRGGRDFGWLDPTGPALENIERVGRIVSGRKEVKLSALADMLAPHWREIIQSLSDRQGATFKKSLANTYVPFASTVNALNRGGSPIDQLDRFLGQSTEPPISVQNQRKERAAEINSYLDEIEQRGFEMPEEEMSQLMQAHAAYERYKELSARVTFGLRDQGKDPSLGKDSKNHRLRASILIAVAEEMYPDSLDFTLEDYDDLTEEGRDVFYREVEEGLWGKRQDFLREAKEAFGKAAA